MASERDIQDVINTLIAEGIGEGPEGMRRIAETILNRAEQRGISPAEVVRQRAQYTGYSNPGPGAVQAMRDPNAITAAQAAWQMAQGPDDPTNGANHYWNPNIVNPSWAGSMQSLGQYGNHAFATDMPNWQRPAPRVAPTPLMASSALQGSRAVTSPSGGNTALQSALEQVATRERNRVTPASVEERVTARNRVTIAPTKNPALEQAARRDALTMNQSYAGQDRAPATQVGTTPQQINQAARTAALKATQSYAGQDRAPTPQATQLPRMSVPLAPVGSSNIASQREEQLATRAKPVAVIPDRLMPSPTGLPALYGTMTPQQVAQIGVPAVQQKSPRPLPLAATSAKIAPVPLTRPGGLMQASAPMAAPRISAPPLMAQSQQPLRIVIPQANAIPYPQARPQTIISQQRVNAGRDAVSQSGDTSSGNQREAAERRAMGDAWRASR